MKLKLSIIGFVAGCILALPVFSLATQGYCLDCWSSYSYGPPWNPQTCYLSGYDIGSQECYYTCTSGSGPEPFIQTFCDNGK